MDKRIQISHGSGGEVTRDLIESVFLPALGNDFLKKAEDGARVEVAGPVVMTTDAFTVKPLFFPGGDIGKLAVAGVCNDLAVMGAKPAGLGFSFIIEEGFAFSDLKKIAESMGKELKINDTFMVCSDTKIVEKGLCDGVYITGSGVGIPEHRNLTVYNTRPGDEVVISGDVGDHGTVVLMKQDSMTMKSSLVSDCQSLWPAIGSLMSFMDVRAMRDITRGGLATILNELAVQSGLQLTVEEEFIPVKDSVQGFCEILGFHPYHLACEGTFAVIVPKGEGETCRDFLRKNGFERASLIGSFAGSPEKKIDGPDAPVILKTRYGTSRRLEPVRGEMLPRIC